MTGYHIILVDDEKRMIQSMELVLSMEGHTVTTAESGIQACEIIDDMYQKGQNIDLIITDIYMPQMSGLELIDKINESGRNLKILGISGYPDNEISDELQSKGCAGLISKPFTPDQLISRITEIFGSTK